MPEYVISLLNIQVVNDLMADTAIYAIMLSVQENEIRKVAGRFGFHDVSGISRISAGHINATYRIDTAEGQFILQRINTSVFTEPERMMENISIVTEKIPELRIIKTEDGRLCDREGYGVFRMYNFIPDSVSYEYIDSDQLAERMGKALRNFHTVLSGIDASSLSETLPHFHDMAFRFRQFDEALDADRAGRKDSVKEEIRFLTDGKERASIISSLYAEGKLPGRVTHNDTKLSNVLFDRNTGEYITFIDLDTVMPGTLLFDTGDMIRTGCSMAREDEENPENVHFSLSYFNAMKHGYLDGNDMLTPLESSLFAESGRTITFIMALRFLTDYLNGDVYYQTRYSEHNLVRARNQIKLVKEMDEVLGGQV